MSLAIVLVCIIGSIIIWFASFRCRRGRDPIDGFYFPCMDIHKDIGREKLTLLLVGRKVKGSAVRETEIFLRGCYVSGLHDA